MLDDELDVEDPSDENHDDDDDDDVEGYVETYNLESLVSLMMFPLISRWRFDQQSLLNKVYRRDTRDSS